MNMIKNMDKKPAKIDLNIESVSSYKTKTGGFLSLVFILAGITIFVIKVIASIQGLDLYYSMQIVKQNDISQLDISSGQFQVQLVADNSVRDQKNYHIFRRLNKVQHTANGTADLSRRRIKFSQYSSYGLKLVLVVHNISFNSQQKQKVDIQQYPMVECPNNPSRGCLPQGLNHYIKGRTDFETVTHAQGQVFREYAIILEKCDKNQDIKCNPELREEEISVMFIWRNNGVYPNATQGQQPIVKENFKRKFQSHQMLSKNLVVWTEIYLNRVIIKTDKSVAPTLIAAPTFQTQTGWFYDQQKNEQIVTYINTETYYIISLHRSAYTYVYTRSYDKLDSMLGQVFGMLSLIGFIVFGVYSGYNQWCFQQFMRSRFGIPNYRANLVRYYQYKCKKLMNKISGKRVYKDQFIQQDKNLKNLTQKLNILAIHKATPQIPDSQTKIPKQPMPCGSKQKMESAQTEKQLRQDSQSLKESLLESQNINIEASQGSIKS